MTERKKKIFVIADHPYAPSGVGTQTKYVIETLLKTGKYQVVCFGGAVKHQDYNPQKTKEWGDDLVIYPVDGYGTQEAVRSVLWTQKPDVLWFMTDPRFYVWLWDMENEIRSLVPMIYYHVWDNFPLPKFNRNFYLSNDFIATISKVTDEIVRNVSPEIETRHIPHAVDTEIFKPFEEEDARMISEFIDRNTSGKTGANFAGPLESEVLVIGKASNEIDESQTRISSRISFKKLKDASIGHDNICGPVVAGGPDGTDEVSGYMNDFLSK